MRNKSMLDTITNICNKSGGPMGKVFHVSKKGNDSNKGTEAEPFLTIQRAADIMSAGDTVIVHEGVYREWVNPKAGGRNDASRITYMAAEGEKAVIKGSEIWTDWKKFDNESCSTVWQAKLPDKLFGEYNPFLKKLEGDWLIAPQNPGIHLGDVYINGISIYEAFSLEEVFEPERWEYSQYETWGMRKERILNPELTMYRYYAEHDDDEKYTVLTVNFQGKNPCEELVEISVRRSCFYPLQTGMDYITVRGFELAHAATPWAPPTADQPGLIGAHWSKGWIIEENDIHDAKCSAVSLGKDAASGDNEYTRQRRKPGYQNQMESVFRGLALGWSRERTGSHIVRNNRIHDCGQNGIVGHMGGVFSEIYGNEIYNIAVKHEFYGHEIGGIKLHAAIDVYIHHNYIHNCSLGTWLDWEAQGTRVSSNLYDENDRDFMIEVTHGPALVDHNIFTAAFSIVNAAQGTAFVHNLCGGFMSRYPVLNRATPYHLPHSTQVLSTTPVYGGDDRWYQNILFGGPERQKDYGTVTYDGSPVSLEEYIERVQSHGIGDVEFFEKEKQPCYINGNLYLNGAASFEAEQDAVLTMSGSDFEIEKTEDGVYLKLKLDIEQELLDELETVIITSDILGETRLTQERYEKSDGSDYVLDTDICGEKLKHNEKCMPGPFNRLRAGENRFKVWQNKDRGK